MAVNQSQPDLGDRRRPRRTMGLIGGALAVAVAAAVGAQIANRDGSSTPDLAADDPGVSHVHGLGINPADGSLVVATHYGSFRVPDGKGKAARIGSSYQDTMGFTVAGPNHFFGSGHPDVAGMRAGQPGRLGLVESVDAGATWTSLSLSGEVDFHGLAVDHGKVYGWDSGTGRFMVSEDQMEWETRSTVDLVGFAVDPDDEDHLVGTGPDGLLDSVDGGRTWSQTDGPDLLPVSWDADAGLWGADAGGAVWRYDGSAWTRTGALPGEPQALLATPEVLYAAAHDADGVTGIYQSTDDGRTWELRYRDPDT
jgi:hypothetical protein